MKQRIFGGTPRTGQGPEFANWRMCRHVLFVALFFGCQLLAQCDPQTFSRTRRNGPNGMSRYTVSVDGTDPSSMLKGLDLAGFEQVKPGQSPGFGFGRQLSGLGLDTPQGFGKGSRNPQNQGRPGLGGPQKLGRQGSGLGSPQKLGRQSSGLGADPFGGLDDWRKQIEQKMGAMGGGMFDNMGTMGNMGKGLGGMTGKPNQLGKSKSMGSGGDWNQPGGWGQQGGQNQNQNQGGGGRRGRRNRRNNSRRGGGGNGNGSGAGSGNFAQECLAAHNEYREKHGVPPLKLNSQLSQVSQEWAEHLANVVGGMQHRDDSKYGENIFYQWSSDPSFSISGREAVDSWYAEINMYQFGSSSGGMGTGHFTQVVWKDSTELGVGYAKSPDNKIFVVCNYNPAGNFMGRYAQNVPPVGGFTEADMQNQQNEEASNGFGDDNFGDSMQSMFGGF